MEGGQKERRERPVSSVSRRAVRVPLSPGSGRRLAVFSPATRKKKLIDLSLRDLQPLFPTSQPRGNRAPSTHSRHATVTSRAKDFGTFTAASHSSLARQEKKEGPLSASPPQKRLLPRRFSNQCRLSPRRLSTFRNVKRSKMSRRRLRVEGCGAKKDATERFPKGSAEGQPADKC